jgi:hypothetical protein
VWSDVLWRPSCFFEVTADRWISVCEYDGRFEIVVGPGCPPPRILQHDVGGTLRELFSGSGETSVARTRSFVSEDEKTQIYHGGSNVVSSKSRPVYLAQCHTIYETGKEAADEFLGVYTSLEMAQEFMEAIVDERLDWTEHDTCGKSWCATNVFRLVGNGPPIRSNFRITEHELRGAD